jgi:hypothetical protein
MYIGPSFKNEPDTPCRAFEHLVVLSSTSQDKVSLEASNAGNDTLLPNVWWSHTVKLIAVLGLLCPLDVIAAPVIVSVRLSSVGSQEIAPKCTSGWLSLVEYIEIKCGIITA